MELKECFNILLIFITILNVKCTPEIARPRGVAPSRAALYNSDKNFVCFDNNKSIPFSQVNDDYCDCPDGSDEPGTSACPNGIFYCTNAHHKPINLQSNRVNDGVCDCCDGSDEYARKTIVCPNICLQLGKQAREEAQRMAELVKAGTQLKTEMSHKGIQLKEEKKKKMLELEKFKIEAEKVKLEKQQLKDEIEAKENKALDVYRKLEEEERQRKAEEEAAKSRQEATETFSKFDSNQDGLVDITEIRTRQSFDKDRNGEVTEEEAKYFLNNKESVDLEEFISDAWTSVKPYLMIDAGMFTSPKEEKSTPSEVDDLQNAEEADEEDLPEEEEDVADEGEQPQEPLDEPIIPSSPYDEETQKIVDEASKARNEYAEAERAVRDIDTEMRNIQDYLAKDFGPEEEFAPLEGECFEYTDHEYIYKLCPFENAIQQQKSSSGETRLGSWGKWNGPDDNKFDSMLYDRGQSCWNGPQRSCTVKLLCGIENKVISVSEPNRCEYLFEFVSPAACKENVKEVEFEHDEL